MKFDMNNFRLSPDRLKPLVVIFEVKMKVKGYFRSQL